MRQDDKEAEGGSLKVPAVGGVDSSWRSGAVEENVERSLWHENYYIL